MVDIVKSVNVDLKRLRELYRQVKTKSNNFKNIDPMILAQNSQRLVIFRLALGLSSEAFAKLCKRSSACVYNLEKKGRSVDFNTANYYIYTLKNLKFKKLISFETIENNYKKFYGRALKGVKVLSKEKRKNFAKKGSIIALKIRKENKEKYYKASRVGLKLQGLTKQEKEIIEILDESKIKYKIHEFIGKENVDIYIGNDKEIIINCCRVRNNKNITKHARRLMYQAYRIKYKNPKIKYFAILSNTNKNLNQNDIPLGAIDLLNEICDDWFVDSNINNLIHAIRVGSKLQAHQAYDQ